MNFQQDWDTLCARARQEATRYAALHPERATRFFDEAGAFGDDMAPTDGHELTQPQNCLHRDAPDMASLSSR